MTSKIAIICENWDEYIEAQRKCIAKGYSWSTNSTDVQEPHATRHLSRRVLFLNSFENGQFTFDCATVLSNPYYRHFLKLEYKDINWEAIPMIPTLKIKIADDGHYKLFTNSEGTLFTAGCMKDLSREAALHHWSYGQARSRNKERQERALIFTNAIKEHIEAKEPEHIIKYRQMVNDATVALKVAEEDLEAAIKAEEEKKKKSKRFLPEENEQYYTVSGLGMVVEHTCFNTQNNSDSRQAYQMGSIYRTIDEAEHQIKRIKAINRINDLIDEANDGWTPKVWRDNPENHKVCQLSYSYTRKQILHIGRESRDPLSVFPLIKDRDAFEEVKSQITQEEIDILWNLNN